MKISKIHALYFSGTGTTEKIVKTLAQGLAEKLEVGVDYINFTVPKGREVEQQFGADELVIVGVPVYAGRVPNVLLPYLTEKLHGNGGMAIPIVLFGNRNFDDGLIELRNILEKNGMHTVAGAGFVGEHAFSRTLGAGRPDAADLAELDAFVQATVEKICHLEHVPNEPIVVRGEDPIRPYYTPRDRHGNPVNILKVKPLTDLDKCTQCGLCAKLCPMGSIDKTDASLITGICIKCCACVKKCPMDAKYYTDEKYLYHQHELEEQFERRAEPEWFV